MIKKLLLAFLFITLVSTENKAQEITPTELIQLFKYWRMDVKDFDRNTNDALQLIDKKRLAPENQDQSGNDFVISWLYFKKPKEIPLEYGLIGTVSNVNSPNPRKILAYNFKGKKLWIQYAKQMDLIGATNYNTVKQGDGTAYWLVNSSLKFILTEYPPGINGKDATYSVAITPR